MNIFWSPEFASELQWPASPNLDSWSTILFGVFFSVVVVVVLDRKGDPHFESCLQGEFGRQRWYPAGSKILALYIFFELLL